MVEQGPDFTEFRAGRVLSRSFSILFRNILPFGLLALVITSPTYVYSLLTGSGDPFAQNMNFSVEPIVLGIVNYLLGYVVTAALVFGTIQDLRNEKVSVGECFSKGLAKIFPVLGVSLVSGLLTGLAALAFFIPGVIVAIMLWVAIPVAVIENRGLNSLPRSAELTRGYRWRIFFLVLLLLAVMFGAGMVVGVGTAAITGFDTSGSVTLTSQSLAAVLALDWIFSAFISALSAVLIAVSYHDLRVDKEGADTDQIAAVFD